MTGDTPSAWEDDDPGPSRHALHHRRHQLPADRLTPQDHHQNHNQAPYTCARRNTVNRIRAWWRANIIATLPGSYSRLDRLDGLR